MDLAKALAKEAEGAPSLLLLTGPAGVGKTHILRAALSHRARLCPGARVVRVAAPEVVERLVAAAQHGLRIELASVGWESAQLLALDDLDALAGLPVTQREVARLARLAARSGTRLLCAAGASLGPLEPLLASLRDEPGFVLARLEAADHRESRRILVELARQAGLRPSRRLQAAVAASAHSDVRRALGALRSYLFELDVAARPVARMPRVAS